MRAFVYNRKTTANGLKMEFSTSTPEPPEPAANHVTVQVRAISINPVDYKIIDFPIVGWGLTGKPVAQDFAGVVIKVGTNSKFEIGDRVYGCASQCCAEKLNAADSDISKMPAASTFIEAASLPTAALTSLQALKMAKIGPCSKVLIVGASGGTGSMGVMIAHQLLCPEGKLVAICGPSNMEFVKSLGAHEVVDYNDSTQFSTESPTSILKANAPFDIVYDTVTSPDSSDTVGGVSYDKILKPFRHSDGMTVAINGSPRRWISTLLGFKSKDYALFLMKKDSAQLTQIANWTDTGGIKPIIDSVFPFTAEGVTAAYEKLKGRRARGKICIDICDGTAKK
eukprot:gene7241-14773_t